MIKFTFICKNKGVIISSVAKIRSNEIEAMYRYFRKFYIRPFYLRRDVEVIGSDGEIIVNRSDLEYLVKTLDTADWADPVIERFRKILEEKNGES